MHKAVELARIRKAVRDCPTPILEPLECVKSAVERFGDSLSVSCSFGACSVVVLHMTLQVKSDVKVIFNNTGVQYRETYAYRDLLLKKWKLNLIETKPTKSFWQCIKQYGFPLYRGKSGKKQGNPGKPKCCKYLKELPMKKACKQHKIKATITGLRAAESRARMFAFAQLGQNFASRKFFNIWKFNPIAFWTHEQVWSYIEEHQIPVNELYLKGHHRSGCQPCTGFKGWQQILAKENPALYKHIQHLRGLSLISDFFTLENKAVETACGNGVIPNQTVLEEWFG